MLVIMNTAAALCRERNRATRPTSAGGGTHRATAEDQQAPRRRPKMRAGTTSVIIDQNSCA